MKLNETESFINTDMRINMDTANFKAPAQAEGLLKGIETLF